MAYFHYDDDDDDDDDDAEEEDNNSSNNSNPSEMFQCYRKSPTLFTGLRDHRSPPTRSTTLKGRLLCQ